jgi:hypothetical protein
LSEYNGGDQNLDRHDMANSNLYCKIFLDCDLNRDQLIQIIATLIGGRIYNDPYISDKELREKVCQTSPQRSSGEFKKCNEKNTVQSSRPKLP